MNTVFALLLLSSLGAADLPPAADPGCQPALPQAVVDTAPATPATPARSDLAVYLEAGMATDDVGATVETLPTCPTIQSCGGYNYLCIFSGCSTADTGYKACQTGSIGVRCPPGETIHVTTCGCTGYPAACCSGPPPNCLCAPCNSSSRSVSCQ